MEDLRGFGKKDVIIDCDDDACNHTMLDENGCCKYCNRHIILITEEFKKQIKPVIQFGKVVKVLEAKS
jgi:hypothetical protein